MSAEIFSVYFGNASSSLQFKIDLARIVSTLRACIYIYIYTRYFRALYSSRARAMEMEASNPIVTTAAVNCRRIRFFAWIWTSGNDLPAGQKNPLSLGRKIDYRVFLLPGAVSAFPHGRLPSSSVAHK